MVVFLLLVVAAGLAAATLFTSQIVLAYVAVALCVVSLAAVALPLWRELRTRMGQRTAEAVPEEAEASEPEQDTGLTVAEESEPEPAEDAVADAVVYVIPGRMRYHREGCAVLNGRDHERVTLDEAREESFSQCTSCGAKAPAARS